MEDFKPFRQAADLLIKAGAVKAVEFAGATYQVQIADPEWEEPIWAFLQFDLKGELKDRFCSCEEGGEVMACAHLAAAYSAIYDGTLEPLHKRFEQSLWFCLAQIAYRQWGERKLLLKTRQGKVSFGKAFTMEPKNGKGKAFIKDVFLERPVETEETSLKFSNLSADEIKKWREGRPSPKLSFELSSWYDFAKQLMLLKEPYDLSFEYAKNQLPRALRLSFPSMTIVLEIEEENLPLMIPFLREGPLKVHTQEEGIEKILYDEKNQSFQVISRGSDPELLRRFNKEGMTVGAWIYLPKEGFYPKNAHPLLLRPYTPQQAFRQFPELIVEKLRETPIHSTLSKVSYLLSFDPSWNLHITSYLFQPGDLSVIFGAWAYLKGKGFYHLEGMEFDTARLVVIDENVPDLIRRHRAWLDKQPGFNTHLAGIETVITYTVTDEGRLQFSKRAVLEEEAGAAKDFGAWVYLKGQGFFAKVQSPIHLPIKDTLSISPDQIPLFIRANHRELEGIVGFFSACCPVEKSGLKIELADQGTIAITPEYRLLPAYQEKQVRFYDEFVFVQEEGFSQIPAHLRLPARYFHPYYLEKDRFYAFFSFDLDKIRPFILSIDPRLEKPKNLELQVESLVEENGRYSLLGAYRSEKGSIPLEEVLRATTRYLFTSAGLIDLDDERFQWIRGKEKFEGKRLNLSSLELLRLAVFDPPYVHQGKEILERLLRLEEAEEPDISLLKSHLRPYQMLGVKWLWFLYRHQLSGLLCDDMGLGKTHQAMALIAAIKKPVLVVCPTSVIFHWEEKLATFLPDFKVIKFHGTGRVMEDGYDILLTTYGIWRKEAATLSKIPFGVAFFDEIHAAKNQKSRVHASLTQVQAPVKIGMTGTPIENRLRELKALFDLILPGLMPSEARFRDEFIIPIEKENSQKRKELLHRFIKPFILRRRKEEVLFDLPEKIEEVSHCELSLDQRLLYGDLLNKVRDRLLQELKDDANPVPYLHIFSVLSGLKQICNHPAAYLKIPEAYGQYQSGKWELFTELLNEALESGQKVVVFSQYLAMLDIMGSYLKENNIGYAEIRGATAKRGEEVHRFNEKPDCLVFLGSLQAAGLGIDLTAGSVVIHYDRWWNAAREDQATDRVHRIGQTRGVQVFKLVTKGTFEEKIDEMISRKGKLMEEVVGIDDYRFMKQFDRHELMQLLSSPLH